jgi:hypothetical protein
MASKAQEQEVAHWKQIATSQRHQLLSLENEIVEKNKIIAEYEGRIQEFVKEKKMLVTSRNTLMDKYNTLRKNAMTLESLRKQITSMLEFTPATVIPDENSFTEGGGGGGINIHAGHHDISHIDFDDKINHSRIADNLNSTDYAAVIRKFDESIDIKNGKGEKEDIGGGEPDAPRLYRKIRGMLTTNQFDSFANAITKFNSGAAGKHETISYIETILKQDKSTLDQMKALIDRAAVPRQKV